MGKGSDWQVVVSIDPEWTVYKFWTGVFVPLWPLFGKETAALLDLQALAFATFPPLELRRCIDDSYVSEYASLFFAWPTFGDCYDLDKRLSEKGIVPPIWVRTGSRRGGSACGTKREMHTLQKVKPILFLSPEIDVLFLVVCSTVPNGHVSCDDRSPTSNTEHMLNGCGKFVARCVTS